MSLLPYYVLNVIAYVQENDIVQDINGGLNDLSINDNQNKNFEIKIDKTERLGVVDNSIVVNKIKNGQKSKVVIPFLEKLKRGGFYDEANLKRLHIIFLLNRPYSIDNDKNESLGKELYSSKKELLQYLDVFGSIKVKALFWRKPWIWNKTFDQVETHYQQLKMNSNIKAKKLLNKIECTGSDDDGVKENIYKVPYQELRDTLKNLPQTKEIIKGIRNNDNNAYIYISLVDIDTLDFNQIYSSYDSIIQKYIEDEKELHVVSTGYEFSSHLQNEIEPKYSSPLHISSNIDRSIRTCIAKHLPFGVYYPEPNTLIYVLPDKETIESFLINGGKKHGHSESSCLLKNLIENRKLIQKFIDYKDVGMVFSSLNPIITSIPPRAMYLKNEKSIFSFAEDVVSSDSYNEDEVNRLCKVNQSHGTSQNFCNFLIINTGSKIWKNQHYNGSLSGKQHEYKKYFNGGDTILTIKGDIDKPIMCPEFNKLFNIVIWEVVKECYQYINNVLKPTFELCKCFIENGKELKYENFEDTNILYRELKIESIKYYCDLIIEDDINIKTSLYLHENNISDQSYLETKNILCNHYGDAAKDKIDDLIEKKLLHLFIEKILNPDLKDNPDEVYKILHEQFYKENRDGEENIDDLCPYEEEINKRIHENGWPGHFNSEGHFRNFDSDDSDDY